MPSYAQLRLRTTAVPYPVDSVKVLFVPFLFRAPVAALVGVSFACSLSLSSFVLLLRHLWVSGSVALCLFLPFVPLVRVSLHALCPFPPLGLW